MTRYTNVVVGADPIPELSRPGLWARRIPLGIHGYKGYCTIPWMVPPYKYTRARVIGFALFNLQL